MRLSGRLDRAAARADCWLQTLFGTGWAWGAGLVVTGLLAAWRSAFGFYRLLLSSAPKAGLDIARRWTEVHLWVGGKPVYGAIPDAVYPPASYIMLWPLVGWLPQAAVRWAWASILLAMLAALWWMLAIAADLRTWRERLFAGLTLLAAQSTSAAIAVGQLVPLLMVCLLLAAWFAHRRPARIWWQSAATLLMLFALVKPSLAAPFACVLLVGAAPGWVAAGLGAGYLLLSLAAARFQSAGLGDLVRQWVSSTRAVAPEPGYGNLDSLLLGTPFEPWLTPARVALLAALAVWVARNRREDPLLIVAVAAVVARVWAYHHLYDDMLMLFPLAWLARTVRAAGLAPCARLWGTCVLAAAWVVLLGPARFALLPLGVEGALNVVRTLTWLVLLVAVLVVRPPSLGKAGRAPALVR